MIESYIVQLDFSAANDRVSHSESQLRYICVGGSALSVCREFLSNRRQRVVVDCATSKRTPIISGMPQGSVLGTLLFILYTGDIFELVENRLYAYADDSTFLAVVRKPADRHAVAASLNRDLARTQEWRMILNSNKTSAVVVSRSMTVNPPHGGLVSCLGFPFPSASVRVQHIQAAAAAHILEFEVSRCRTSKFAWCFQPAQTRVWNYLHHTVWHQNVRWVYGSSQSLVASLSLFFSFLRCRCLWGCVSNL